MIAPDHDRRLHFALRDQLIERFTRARTLAHAEPADARRQALKLHPRARELDPATKMRRIRYRSEHRFFSRMNVGRIAGERDPTEGSLSFAKQRANIGGHEARKRERVCIAAFDG